MGPPQIRLVKAFKQTIKRSAFNKHRFFIVFSPNVLEKFSIQDNVIKSKKFILDGREIFVTKNHVIVYSGLHLRIYSDDLSFLSETELQCAPNSIVEGYSGTFFALCRDRVAILRQRGNGEEIDYIYLGEAYRDLVYVEKPEELLILVGLWGVSAIDMKGKFRFFRTFGDLILNPKKLSTKDFEGILVASRNGWFYLVNFKGDVVWEADAGGGLTSFELTKCNDEVKILFTTSEGDLKSIELGEERDIEELAVFDETVHDIHFIEPCLRGFIVTSRKLYLFEFA